MNRKPATVQLNTVKTDFQRRFPRRQATLASLVPKQKLLNLLCFSGAFFQSYGVVLSFYKSETTTSIEYVPTYDLPAITICFDKSDLINTDNETIKQTINKLDISKQLNYTYSYAQLFISCLVITTQDYVPCEDILTITHFVTFDYKCISLHEPDWEKYQTKVKSRLLLNHTHIYTFALNKKLIGGRFDLTLHNLTNPLQILDQNWVKLTPAKYSSAKVSFKHIQMSLLPAPYDTNCSNYKGDSTKANCLNKCFVEEYYWKENYTWPPYKKKTLTNTILIDNSTESEEAEKRTKRQITLPNSVSSLNSASTTPKPANVTKLKAPKNKNPLLSKILEKLNKKKLEGNKSKGGLGYNFLTQKLFNEGLKFKFKDEYEFNTNFMSEKKYSISGKPDIRGYCDYRCDRGQECFEDIYKPIREAEIEGSTEENAQSYIVEIQPSKYVFKCSTFEKYKRVHLACFLASTLTLWFGGSILLVLRYLIRGNLHTIRCLFCCNRKLNRE